MKRWWEKIKAWDARRKQRGLERWAQERTRGQGRFIIRMTMLYAAMILTMREFYDGNVGLFTIATTHLTGLLIAYTSWGTSESSFKRALTEGRVKAAPSGVLPEKRPLDLGP